MGQTGGEADHVVRYGHNDPEEKQLAPATEAGVHYPIHPGHATLTQDPRHRRTARPPRQTVQNAAAQCVTERREYDAPEEPEERTRGHVQRVSGPRQEDERDRLRYEVCKRGQGPDCSIQSRILDPMV